MLEEILFMGLQNNSRKEGPEQETNFSENLSWKYFAAYLRRSAPTLASKFGYTPIALIPLVKNILPNEAQKPSALMQKLPPVAPRVFLFKKKKIKKLVGIYADWIDEESFLPVWLVSISNEFWIRDCDMG
ncbi:uncharacterized protein [Spinacia oleracea]|uniref:Uncharacterized protein isoform X2 n=1 Tax=Spinacia oleracea TaxID=3562 RepID=A0ABM3RA44_SPIOL|nr:uncharacterized protein LOC110797679 isoform X2 [Spinacia oleracea]XP_056692478.1 uncharacterized protein LOC110797679 isoform X3 [Spinacia oleracea]